jgi:hypothetical protein
VVVVFEHREQGADEPLLDRSTGRLDLSRSLGVETVEEGRRLLRVLLRLIRPGERGEENRYSPALEWGWLGRRLGGIGRRGSGRQRLRRRVDLRVVVEDLPLEVLEVLAWLDADFVERRAQVPVHVERLALPSRAVEREH